MAKDDEMTRSVTVSYNVTAGDVGVSNVEFKVYPGTEMIYGQAINKAITDVLAALSKVAYVKYGKDPEGLSGDALAEVAFGSIVEDAS